MDNSQFAIITYLKKNRKRIPWIYKFPIKVKDPFSDFYTKIIIGVPLPLKSTDKPCVLVSIRNSYQSILMRFEGVDELCKVFNPDFIGDYHWERLYEAHLEAMEKVLEYRQQIKKFQEFLLTSPSQEKVEVDFKKDGDGSALPFSPPFRNGETPLLTE